jgi:hypothetical protein
MLYPKSYKNRYRPLQLAPTLPDLSLLSQPHVLKRGHAIIPKDYDYRYDDVLGRAQFFREDDRDYLTVRYYLSLKINRPAENDFPLFWGYVLWQEHLNYDAFWQDGELKWDEYHEVLVIDSYVDKWRWIRPDGKENWDAEKRFSTLRLLQVDWERKRQELGYDRLWSFQHRHHTIDKKHLQEISRLVWDDIG